MCGICGIYNYKDIQRPVDIADIKRMTSTMIHRGPDDEGYHIDGPLGFGFRRLSIIDLAGGHQPMSDMAESVWVIFNGEIYNYPALKKELESYGHVFRTKSDTEVIIHGYKQWGTDVFNHLNGMFGIGLWDVNKRQLVLARDAMGIKLIYYKFGRGCVLFGSEIGPITACEDTNPDVDPAALNLFLRYRYTPSPLTIYKGVKKLAPGTMLVLASGTSRVERWYQYKPSPFLPPKTAEQARAELLELYKAAVKRHLLSDVPLGILLSGGLDSGLLLGLMNLFGKEWPSFTVGYGESYKGDELSDAKGTSGVFSSKHVSVELDQNTFNQNLSKIVSLLEEPIAASSIVPMYYVCQRARQDVKVALVGQGPDELFGGYNRHLGVHYGRYWRALPGWVKAGVNSAIRSLPRNETLKRGIYSLDVSDRMKRYQQVFSIQPGNTIENLFHRDLLPDEMDDKVLECWKDLGDMMEETDELGGFQLIEIRSSLPDELLMYADKMSMAHGLEVRVPYLDREVVEYVEKLPASFKVRNGKGKWLHRQVCKQYLPAEIMRRKKGGFAVNVVDGWFQNSMNSKMADLLVDDNSLMFSYLRVEAVKKLLKDHLSKASDNHKILFSLVVFEEWLRAKAA